jgi:mono/diheme cytochrome c family protein
MRAAWLIYGTLGWWSGTGSILAGLSPQQLAQLPPPATITVQFQRDVQALLEARCVQCHGRGKASGKFSLESRETTLAGGSSGPAVVPGRSAESYLIELVSGVDPDNVMPAKGTRLTPEEVGLLRAWIDQGLSWEPAINFARPAARNLSPRRPELPASASNSASSSSQPVDRFVQSYFDQAGVTMPGAVDDRLFVRRVFLDVIGLIPAPEDMAAFEADSAPDKRARLVRRLLADEEDYAVHWLTFWNDALRNDYQGTGYIDGGRRQITGWLYRALAENRPFDQFVRELVNPEPDAAGFVNGIIWRGVVNASQTPEMQAAQNVSQVFMGVNLKCASCHDSFINDWTLADAYGLAGVYAQEPLEMVHCDKPTGEVAPLRFLYPELGEIQPQLSREERLRQLADLMTGERNGRLSRTIVNRIWARLMGRGLVEPLDDMEQAAWHPELLDWLAADLVDHGYDLKRTLELILTSQAYQLPSVPAAENTKADFAFRGPTIRRLTAEQFLDAVSRITGVWNMLPTARANFQATDSPTEPPTATAGWIWTNPGAGTSAPPQTVRWRRDFQLATAPDAAIAVVACDNEFRLFVNGQPVGSGKDFSRPQLIDLSSVLERGRNVIAIETVNAPANPDKPELDQSSPAGLLAQVSTRSGAKPESPEPRFFRIGTDQSWRWTLEETEGWTEPGFDDSTWNAAVELGSPESGPWNLGEPWRATVSIETWVGRARAALMANDPLMTALGRPNREQVVTSRPTAATTLQALELTNGETLAQALRRGVARLLEDGPASVDQSVVVLYQRALGRPPTLEESRLARVVLGSGQEPAGLEDMLWAMIMLPEFQLIH